MATSSSSSSRKVRPVTGGGARGDAAEGTDDGRVGILSFEVANAMSRAANLYRSLSDAEAARLLGPLCLGSQASARKLPTDEARRALEQRTRWRRHDVRRLRDSSLWNWTYDKAVLLLARGVCAIYDRIRLVFGDPMQGLDLLAIGRSSRQCDQSRQLSGPVSANNSGYVRTNFGDAKSGPIARIDMDTPRSVNFRSNCGASPGKMFMECLSLSSSVSWKDGFEDEFLEDASCISTIRSGMLVPFSGDQGMSMTATKSGKIGRRARFGPKSTVTSLAPASTIGGSALALHYANVVIIIEKLLRYPHLVGEEARDDLYQMLPSSLRAALRKSLKTYVKSMAIYDAFLAHDWRETLEKTLTWLAPMAHNMIRWQAERNFEQQQIVLKGNVLLLQTLYFADREKTEAVICELLVGLNYICRYEQQQNALLDCSSSLDFDDCMEWQLQ
uniref:DUF668 domain-containing protein n=1 Tax=Oryza brachyantha TaxID=4533 RepID=J3LVN4_ORYBR